MDNRLYVHLCNRRLCSRAAENVWPMLLLGAAVGSLAFAHSFIFPTRSPPHPGSRGRMESPSPSICRWPRWRRGHTPDKLAVYWRGPHRKTKQARQTGRLTGRPPARDRTLNLPAVRPSVNYVALLKAVGYNSGATMERCSLGATLR